MHMAGTTAQRGGPLGQERSLWDAGMQDLPAVRGDDGIPLTFHDPAA
jgi:hypothetical protein